MGNFILKKILNNNVIMAQDLDTKEEAVLIGQAPQFPRILRRSALCSHRDFRGHVDTRRSFRFHMASH